MIYINSNKFTVDGVDVYPDHESKTQFWYVPGTVRLAERDQRKVLSYLWYTDSQADSDGTGFLNFEVNTAVSDETLGKIKSEIARLKGIARETISLSTVTYQSGNVNFSVLGPVAALASAADVKKDVSVLYSSEEQLVWSAGSSSLVGDNAAVCSVKFTKEGKLAAAMQQAIVNGSNSIAALYRLDFLAMRPSVTFSVKGKLEKTIKDFQISLGASIPLEVLVLDVGIQAQWQRIMSQTDLDIKIVNFEGEESQGLKWAQQIILDYVLKNFFEVQLDPNMKGKWSPLAEAPKVQEAVGKAKDVEAAAGEKVKEDKAKKGEPAGEGDAAAVKEIMKAATTFIPKVSIRAAYYDGKQVNEIDFLYTEWKARPYVVLPQAMVLEGLKEPRSYITAVNRSQIPFGTEYSVTVSAPISADREKLGLRTVNVQGRYPAGASKDKQKALNLTTTGDTTTGSSPFLFQYDLPASADVEYTVDYVFGPSEDWQSDTYQYSDKGKSDKGLIVAMPETILEFLRLPVALIEYFVWDNADQAVVTVTSKRWAGEKRVVFNRGKPQPQSLQVRSDANLRSEPIEYKVELRASNKTVYAYGPEIVRPGDQISVRDRFEGKVPVWFTAGARVTEDNLELTLTYEDGDFVWEDQFTLEKGAKKIQRMVPTLNKVKRFSDLKLELKVSPPEGDPFRKSVEGGAFVTVNPAAA